MPKPGYLTPSGFKRMMSKGKGTEFGDTAEGYAEELIMEQLGVQLPTIYTNDMEWGDEHEWEAIDLYQTETLNTVNREYDFIRYELLDFVGGIPDGLVGTDGVIEVKCPANPRYHLHNLTTNDQFLNQYWYQIQGYLMITGRKWVDCVSFDPRWPDPFKLAVHRVDRDEPTIKAIHDRCISFRSFMTEYANKFRKGGIK